MIPVAVVVLGCGLIAVIAGLDDDEPDAAAVGALAPGPSSSAPRVSPTPSASPVDDVARYLAGLAAINTRLAGDEEKAVKQGRDTCLDITQGKPRSIVVSNARLRFRGAVAVDEAMAAKIVDVVHANLCPTAVIVADPPTEPPPTATGDNDGGDNDDGGNVYYPNCAAVRAAGKAPLHRGDPGYRAGLDRDGDGVACES